MEDMDMFNWKDDVKLFGRTGLADVKQMHVGSREQDMV